MYILFFLICFFGTMYTLIIQAIRRLNYAPASVYAFQKSSIIVTRNETSDYSVEDLLYFP